ITVTYKSSWDIEWDYDYGFTLVTTDGKNYTSLPSAKGYTTSKTNNPNGSACLDQIDNGLTGTSGSSRDENQSMYCNRHDLAFQAQHPVEPPYNCNTGASPPRQHYTDSQPQPALDGGEALTDDPTTARDDTAKWCDDAAFTAAVGDRHFDDDPATTGASSGE